MPFDDLHDIAKEASGVVIVERLTHHIQRIREAQDRTETAVSQIADALTRLAIVEERQSSSSGAIGKLTLSIENLNTRIQALELLTPTNSRAAQIVDKALWGVAGGAVIYVVQKALGA